MNPRRMQGGAGVRSRRSVPKAQNVKAQGNALGTCETNDQSPKGAKCSCISITPFQGFDVRSWRFLGRCPRLSHCAALRLHTLSVIGTFCRRKYCSRRFACNVNSIRNEMGIDFVQTGDTQLMHKLVLSLALRNPERRSERMPHE